MLALYRRSVRDCRRCGDDDLRRRQYGPRQADRRALGCIDVSVAASCSVLQLAPRTLHWLGSVSVSALVQEARCNTIGCIGVSALLDPTMFVQQARCDMLRCNSFSLLQRWNRARRNTPRCCQRNLCGTTLCRQARRNVIRCNGLHLRIIYCEWLHHSSCCHGEHGSVCGKRVAILCCGTFCVLQWLCCETSAVHSSMSQLGVLRCTTMQHIPRCDVSHGGAARRVGSCAAGPSH